MEKVFRDIGGQASSLAFVKGYTKLIVDDEKLRMRSTKCNDKSLSRNKSSKSFGPVGNCVNSFYSGIPLSFHMSHHGESATEIIQANLMIITGSNNPKAIKIGGTDLAGDRGYNDDEYYEFDDQADLNLLNTMKRGPSLCFKFGDTKYRCNRE